MCISVWEIVADNGGVTLKLFLVLTAPHSLRSIADVNDFITRFLAKNTLTSLYSVMLCAQSKLLLKCGKVVSS